MPVNTGQASELLKLPKLVSFLKNHMSNVTLFGHTISLYRLLAAAFIGTVAVLCATTVGEFAVSVHNRYSVYPVGTDTNMYGNSAIGQMLVCLAGGLCIAHLLRARKDGPFITLAFVLFFVLALLSAQVKSFIPKDWCRYELTMYSCDSQIDYNLNIKP